MKNEIKQLLLTPYMLVFMTMGIIVLSSGCKDDDDDSIDCMHFHWGYEGEEAPEYWAECNPDCDGNSQSPVNISGATADNALNALETHYEDVPIEVINNGHTIEFEYEAGSRLHLNGADYSLLQFHFHTSSEHTINGGHFPMEIHLVHKKSDTELAVIGIMVEEGAENAFLKNFSDHLPATTDAHYSSGDLVNVADLLPAGTGYYTYGGSLTTPPCSETVSWFVMKEPIEASAEQITNFSSILHDNYRPVQALAGRTIKSYN